jgi:hypothetical protein
VTGNLRRSREQQCTGDSLRAEEGTKLRRASENSDSSCSDAISRAAVETESVCYIFNPHKLCTISQNTQTLRQCSASAPLPSATHTVTNEGSKATERNLVAMEAMGAVRNEMKVESSSQFVFKRNMYAENVNDDEYLTFCDEKESVLGIIPVEIPE